MRLTTLFTCLFCLLASGLFAQLANTNVYTRQWETVKRSRNNNNSGAIAMDIQTDAQGNIYTLTNYLFEIGQGFSIGAPAVTKHSPAGTLLWEYQFSRAELLDTTVQLFDYYNGAKLALDVRSNGNVETVSIICQVFTERNIGNNGTRLIYGMLTHLSPQNGTLLINPTYFTDNAVGLMGSYFNPVSIHYGGDGIAWIGIERQTGTGARADYFVANNRITGTTQSFDIAARLPAGAIFATPLIASLGNGYAVGSMFLNAGGGSSALVVSLHDQTGNILLDSILGWDQRDLQRNPTTGRADLLLAGLHLIELDSALSGMAAYRTHGIDTLAIKDPTTGNRVVQGAGRLAYADGNAEPFVISLNTTGNIMSIHFTSRDNRGGLGAVATYSEALVDYSFISQATVSNYTVRYGYGRAEILHIFSQRTTPSQPPITQLYHFAVDLQNANASLNPPLFSTAFQDDLFYSYNISVGNSNERQAIPVIASSPFGLVSARGHFGFHIDSSAQANENSYLFIEYANNVAGLVPADACHLGVTFAWNLPSNICDTAASITLSAQPAGGTFGGPGVTGNVFDPSQFTAGVLTLSYSVETSPGCDTILTRTINVIACSTGDTIPTDTTDPGSRAQLLRAQTSLYPNPAQGSVTLALPAGTVAQDVVLLTAQGQVVRRMDARMMGSELRIELGDLPAGLYFVRAITQQGTLSLPFQKL